MDLLAPFHCKPRKSSKANGPDWSVPTVLPGGGSFVLLMAASKGGTGKSTICIHLAALVAQSGHRTLIIDTDIDGDQQSCIAWSKLRNDDQLKVIPARLDQIPRAIDWAQRRGFTFIVVDTAGRDLAALHSALEMADIMLTPAQPSPLDLQATAQIRRLWRASSTPAALVLNGVGQDNGARALHYMQRYGDLGPVLPAMVSRRVHYADAIAMGLGVSEYRHGGEGDIEMRRLLRAVFNRVEIKAQP